MWVIDNVKKILIFNFSDCYSDFTLYNIFFCFFDRLKK